MASVSRKVPAAVAEICGIRHGHMVSLPGNVWSTKHWIRTKKSRWIPLKGTCGFKLDKIRPADDMMERRVDPVRKLYAYQVDPYPRTKNCDPIKPLCSLTKTAQPIHLSELGHSADSQFLGEFVEHVEECCDAFNRLFHQKNVPLPNSATPLELDKFAKLYSAGFFQNVLNFLFTNPKSGSLLSNSHMSSNIRTGSFWRYDLPKNMDIICHNLQFTNYIDLMLRSNRPLSYRVLRTDSNPDINNPDINTDSNPDINTSWSMMSDSLSNVCAKQLHLFKEIRGVEQYPGFIKETIYPYNHTLFKVVSSRLSDRDLQAATMMTGFGQTVATTQHRLQFPCRVDLLPAVEDSEAVNVVVTDGNRYCLGVYQCNTTNMCNTQRDTPHANVCALSDVQSLVSEGRVNARLVGELLGVLTAERHETASLQTKDGAQSPQQGVLYTRKPHSYRPWRTARHWGY